MMDNDKWVWEDQDDTSPLGSPLLDELSILSPHRGERTAGLSRICDTRETASGGLPHGQVL